MAWRSMEYWKGFPNPGVAELGELFVQADIVDANTDAGEPPDPEQVSLFRKILQLRGVVVHIQDVQLAVLKHHTSGRLVGDNLEDQALAGRSAVPVLVGGEHQFSVELPAIEGEGAGADGNGRINAELIAGLLGGLLIEDGSAGGGQAGQKCAVGLVQGDGEVVIINDLKAGKLKALPSATS